MPHSIAFLILGLLMIWMGNYFKKAEDVPSYINLLGQIDIYIGWVDIGIAFLLLLGGN